MLPLGGHFYSAGDRVDEREMILEAIQNTS